MGDKTGQIAGDMGDRAFGETDEALTVYEIKERDPDFAMMGFMKEVKEVIIPEVLSAAAPSAHHRQGASYSDPLSCRYSRRTWRPTRRP